MTTLNLCKKTVLSIILNKKKGDRQINPVKQDIIIVIFDASNPSNLQGSTKYLKTLEYRSLFLQAIDPHSRSEQPVVIYSRTRRLLVRLAI